jgi:hypothetical protein
VARVDGDGLGLGPQGNSLQLLHSKRVTSPSCNSVALSEIAT